jgi:hypothetical protein
MCRECGAFGLPCCDDTKPGEAGSCSSGCFVQRARGDFLGSCEDINREDNGDPIESNPKAISQAVCVAGSGAEPAMCELCGQLNQTCCAPGKQ